MIKHLRIIIFNVIVYKLFKIKMLFAPKPLLKAICSSLIAIIVKAKIIKSYFTC